MTLAELGERMSSREFTIWQQYSRFNPFGNESLMIARQCAVTANSAGGKKGGGSFSEDDFLDCPRPKVIRKQSDAEVEGILAAVLPKVNSSKPVKKKDAKRKS